MLNKISLPDPPPPSLPESDPHAKPPLSSPPLSSPPPLLFSHREMTPIGGGSTAPAVESINRCLSEICTVPDESYFWENPRRFSTYLKRLQLIVQQFLRSSSSSTDNFLPTVQTALKGISGDLTKSSETLLIYRNKSKIYVLINSQTLRQSLQQHTIAIGGWLALLDSSLVDNPDLHKKTIDLSREMKQSQFTVTENEERVYCTLQKEAEGRQTTKAVQSAIIMDLARALGTDSDNLPELQEQIKLLRNDIAGSNSVAERRILMSLERIFNSWSTEPNITAQSFGLEFEEDSQIQPFKDFLCPLTKEVMKDPVVLESFRTYERTAIEYWFERCIEDGRDPTCPVTGQVLKSLEKKPNISLAGAIEEWVNRNVEIQINLDVECLSEDSPHVESMEHVFDNIYKISEDHPSSRYRIRNAGIVVLIVKILKNCSKSMGSLVRSKALMALLSLAKDEECKLKMLEEGMTRLAIHSLTGSSEREREYAVKLLLEFSSDESYCTNIASEKGALVLLSSMAEDREYLTLCNLAEEVLKKLEKLDGNVQHLAAAGRFEPLLGRLREGSDDVKIEMASMVGKMTLTNSSKEQIARHGAKILVDMLSKPEGRAPSLQALYNLSTLDDNATILIDLGLLMALANILFRNQDAPSSLRELAASTIANIVSKPGHWELACTNKEGVSMQSESVIHSLLGILSHSSPKSEVAVLQILHGIASSPQASESVTTHINSCSGIAIIIPYLEHPEVDHRVHAFKLTRILSERLGQVLASELRASDSISISALKEKLLDNKCTDGERYDAACILANLPLGVDEVKTVLGTDLVRWIVNTLKERHLRSNERASRLTLTMMDGLLGLLLHFVRFSDPTMLDTVRENHLMTVFRDQLRASTQPKVKQRAALGLKYLSETGRSLVASMDFEPQPPQGFFSSLIFSCGKPPHVPPTCPIHSAPCEEYSQFCLLKGNCIKPLLDLLNDEDTSVQISVVESLSTLLYDTSSSCFKRAVDELDRVGVNDAVVSLLTEVRTGELQEKTIWFIERILRVDIHAQQHSMNQTLVRALVEAFKHGNANTKGHAQIALTNLKQISGVSGQNSNQARGR